MSALRARMSTSCTWRTTGGCASSGSTPAWPAKSNLPPDDTPTDLLFDVFRLACNTSSRRNNCPQSNSCSWGLSAFQGVSVSEEPKVEPVTAAQAGGRLNKAAATIRCWAVRYNARQLKRLGRAVYYDYDDLVVIERELFHGHPIPATWQERAAIRERCPLKAAERFPSAA